MGAIADFLTGRSNKLLRDILAATAVVAIVGVSAVSVIRSTVDGVRLARQPLPDRLDASRPANGTITTVTRSVLDDPVFTGSVSGRSVVLDPCSGKEKK